MISLKRILREAGMEAAPLEGKSKTNAKSWVLGKVKKFGTGMHSDAYWHPIQNIWKEFDKLGLDWVPTGAMYEHTEVRLADGQKASVPIRKIWTFEITFFNNRQKKDTLYGRIIAAGAGPEEDPLEKYDVVITVS